MVIISFILYFIQIVGYFYSISILLLILDGLIYF